MSRRKMGKVMMDMVMKCKDWVMARLSERTSWDGMTIIVGSVLVLVGMPIIKMLAWPALVYGVYTLLKEEGHV